MVNFIPFLKFAPQLYQARLRHPPVGTGTWSRAGWTKTSFVLAKKAAVLKEHPRRRAGHFHSGAGGSIITRL